MKSDEKAFRILGVDHIGLAPSLPEEATTFFRNHLGLPYLGDELIVDQKVSVAFCGSFNGEQPAQMDRGEARLEILTPSSEDSPISGFLSKKGGGIHHVALRVDDIQAALNHLKAAGVRLIDELPRKGAHGSLIAFVHPKSTGGLLLELVQVPSSELLGASTAVSQTLLAGY